MRKISQIAGRSPLDLDIAEIAEIAAAFDSRLTIAKRRINRHRSDIAWYPYCSLSCFPTLEKLLTGERRQLLRLAGDEPVLDIGCADGDLSFFLEFLGCRVEAVDHPSTNYNGMRGILALKADLGSALDVRMTDLDSQLDLPYHGYRLALLLGVLYHLKNPYFVLEAIASRAKYCILSTRIAQFAPDRRRSIKELPVAYLLGDGEANEDWTNYWIFSETGLKTILSRAGWEICDYLTVGNTSWSDPASSEGDERAFCLLRSRAAEKAMPVELLSGWHEVEDGCWRWTERIFSARLPALSRSPCRVLRLSLFLPDEVLTRFGAIELTATVSGYRLAAQTYAKPGEHAYVQRIPQALGTGESLTVSFRLSHALAPDDDDPRERGIIVSSITIE